MRVRVLYVVIITKYKDGNQGGIADFIRPLYVYAYRGFFIVINPISVSKKFDVHFVK